MELEELCKKINSRLGVFVETLKVFEIKVRKAEEADLETDASIYVENDLHIQITTDSKPEFYLWKNEDGEYSPATLLGSGKTMTAICKIIYTLKKVDAYEKVINARYEGEGDKLTKIINTIKKVEES